MGPAGNGSEIDRGEKGERYRFPVDEHLEIIRSEPADRFVSPQHMNRQRNFERLHLFLESACFRLGPESVADQQKTEQRQQDREGEEAAQAIIDLAQEEEIGPEDIDRSTGIIGSRTPLKDW